MTEDDYYLEPDSPSAKNSKLQQMILKTGEKELLEEIASRLETFGNLTVTRITPVWYIVKARAGRRIQLQIDNPGGYLEIVELNHNDTSLVFPRVNWSTQIEKLRTESVDSVERVILSHLALRRGD